MGDQRQLFRFRLPWLSAAATPRPLPAPRPAPEPEPEPQPQPQPPSRPTTTIPIQRLPFRPAAVAPPQKTEPQPPPVSLVATEPKPTSLSASPLRQTNQIRASSVPPSPTRRATETTVTSRPVSPPRGTIQTQTTSRAQSPSHSPTRARAASVPPSPSRIAPQPQITEQAASQPAGQTSPQPSSPSLRASQVQTLFPPKRSAMATEVGSQPPSSTQSASQEPTFKPFGVAAKPSEVTTQLKEVAPITVAATETPSALVKPKDMKERKKVGEEYRKATAKDPTHEEPDQCTIPTKILAAATEARTKTRELLGAAWETGKRHREKKEDIERKKTWTTSSTDEKQIKTVSSTYPKISHEKHVTSNREQVPLHKEIREDISKFVHKLTTGQPKLSIDEKSISVLTLAGENKGASFHSGSESKNHIHQGYKINPNDSPDATTDGEESSKDRKPEDSTTKEYQAPRAYVNSNTQSINNSLVFESFVNERNPGVHLDFLYNFADSTKSSAKPESLEPHEVNSTFHQQRSLHMSPQ
ncbi:hypothetical protein PTKIN_Ptkin09bG0118400 [Pterospermum kingtungense]